MGIVTGWLPAGTTFAKQYDGEKLEIQEFFLKRRNTELLNTVKLFCSQ